MKYKCKSIDQRSNTHTLLESHEHKKDKSQLLWMSRNGGIESTCSVSHWPLVIASEPSLLHMLKLVCLGFICSQPAQSYIALLSVNRNLVVPHFGKVKGSHQDVTKHERVSFPTSQQKPGVQISSSGPPLPQISSKRW